MNRRQFLTRALALVPVIAAPAALLEALIPRKSIFLPPRGGWLVTPDHDGNYVYIINQKYAEYMSDDPALIALVKRRMREAAEVWQTNIDKMARESYEGQRPVARVGGIDVYLDKCLPEDTWALRKV